MTYPVVTCHSLCRVAKGQSKLTQDERIAKAFADLERATQLAFDAQGHEVVDHELVAYDKPDLTALAKLIELAFKANGVVGADGKKPPGVDAPVSVQLDELERLLKAAKSKQKESNVKED